MRWMLMRQPMASALACLSKYVVVEASSHGCGDAVFSELIAIMIPARTAYQWAEATIWTQRNGVVTAQSAVHDCEGQTNDVCRQSAPDWKVFPHAHIAITSTTASPMLS